MPVACFRLTNPALAITGGLGVLRLCVAVGDVAVLDTRQPSRSRYPVVLHAGPIRYEVAVLCIATLYPSTHLFERTTRHPRARDVVENSQCYSLDRKRHFELVVLPTWYKSPS